MSTEKILTDRVFCVLPSRFSYNEETAESNAFQKKSEGFDTQKAALAEVLAYQAALSEHGVETLAVKDPEEPHTPDSVFPNNWFSTHSDGTLVLYPMAAENRRKERKKAFLDAIYSACRITRTLDLTKYEEEGEFLEGTGSLVLDRKNKIAYACRSPRTSEKVLSEFCRELGYSATLFDAFDRNGKAVYHTNVMMCLGEEFAVVCLDALPEDQRPALLSSLKAGGKLPIFITHEQMNLFAGNMLELKNRDGVRYLVLSETARAALTDEQTETLSRFAKLLPVAIPCIEENGGGSARCMLAELFC